MTSDRINIVTTAGPILLGQHPPGSPEWHALRANGLGGSEIGAVLGLSPFESRFSLWHRKAGQIADVEQNAQMEWGTRLEAVILAKYKEEHDGLRLKQPGTYAPADRPWQIANPDLWTAERVADAKTSRFGDGYGEDGTDQIPPHVRVQLVWYMDVLQVERGDIALLIGGSDYREYSIQYDASEAEFIRNEGAKFLDDIARRARPDIDGHSATYDAVKELHPDIVPDTVQLDNATARAYIAARSALKAAEEEARRATSTVADLMGDAKTAEWDGTTIARRQARGDGLPYVVAGRNLPDITNEERRSA